jgi:hypothetical protein
VYRLSRYRQPSEFFPASATSYRVLGAPLQVQPVQHQSAAPAHPAATILGLGDRMRRMTERCAPAKLNRDDSMQDQPKRHEHGRHKRPWELLHRS